MSFLVMISRLDGEYRSRAEGDVFSHARGRIDDLGFCKGPDQALSHRPPRPESVPYDFWCRDRFFHIRADESCRSTGHVEVTEALVYDNRMRGDIDFTGFMVTVSLRKDAYQAYLDYVGMVRMP